MSGKAIAAVIALTALLAGAAIYYLQVYAFYQAARLASEGGEVEMKITLAGGQVIDLPVSDFEAIDADSSPIRFRACFTAHLPQDAGLVPYPAAEPLTAPGWFDCFDAAAIGAALETGAATAYLSQPGIADGVDRVIAVYAGGRAFAWHQLNEKYRD